jgi:hypothetical protein
VAPKAPDESGAIQGCDEGCDGGSGTRTLRGEMMPAQGIRGRLGRVHQKFADLD